MANVTLYGPTGLLLNPPAAAIVDPTFAGLRASLRPTEFSFGGTVGGHFKQAFTFSNAAGITTTPLVTIRWAPATAGLLFVLTRLRWTHAILTTAFTTQQLVDVAATIARTFTVADTGGSASIIPGAGKQKARSNMSDSQVQQFITGSTAIVAGTRTLDTNPFTQSGADVASNTVATGGTPLITSTKELYALNPGTEHPVVLANQEGIVVNCPQSLAAVGVVKWGFLVEWLEAVQF